MSDYQRFRPLFAEALDRRLYTIAHLDRLVLSGHAQIWFGDDAAIVTEVRTYPTGARVIHGLVAAAAPDAPPGRAVAEIVEILIPRAEAWGREIGCILAIIESRPGWARALKPHGYEPHQQAVRKEL